MLEFHERQRLFMLVSLLVCLHLFALLLRSARPASWLPLRQNRPGYRRCAADAASPLFRASPKPAWVRHEVIRLKALMPQAGCRSLVDIFTRRFAAKRGVTVGKTFVSDVIRKHRYEIDLGAGASRVPGPSPYRRTWSGPST